MEAVVTDACSPFHLSSMLKTAQSILIPQYLMKRLWCPEVFSWMILLIFIPLYVCILTSNDFCLLPRCYINKVLQHCDTNWKLPHYYLPRGLSALFLIVWVHLICCFCCFHKKTSSHWKAISRRSMCLLCRAEFSCAALRPFAYWNS